MIDGEIVHITEEDSFLRMTGSEKQGKQGRRVVAKGDISGGVKSTCGSTKLPEHLLANFPVPSYSEQKKPHAKHRSRRDSGACRTDRQILTIVSHSRNSQEIFDIL
jgi:hypothetical protein